MSTNLNYKQVANVKRRSWDVEAYEQKAKARAQAEAAAAAGGPAPSSGRHKHPASGGATADETPKRFKLDDKDEETAKEEFKPAEPGAAGPMGSQRAFLQPRKAKVDIDSKIGATEIISAEAAAKTSLSSSDDGVGGLSAKDGVTKSGVGWHCSVCDCFLKDSMTYLDHINGRKHQRKLGFSMRVERSTKDQMLGRLSQLTKEKEKVEKQTPDNLLTEENFEDIVKAKDEEEVRRRAEKAKKRQERKKQKQQAPEPKPEEDEEGDEEEVEEEGINPDLAAMMGFSGFGGGGKT